MQNSLSVLWFGFCLIFGLSVSWLVVIGIGFVFSNWVFGLVVGLCVCWLVVMFGIGFVCLWVGKYVIMPFNSREGVSVGLFNKRL